MNVDDVFLSRVGHDLRGELATMITGIHYLLRYETDLGPTARQMLDRINGAGQRMRRLLDEFDDAAWIDSGSSAELAIESCATGRLVNEAVGRLHQVLTSREVTLDLNVPDDLPAIDADARLCGVAIDYLLDFALARSRKKTVHVSVELSDGLPTLSITDEGGAIDEAMLPRLLEPFVEKDLTPKPEPGQRRRERLGLGLAIARGILIAHGGGIRGEIAPGGEGLTLRCTLARPTTMEPRSTAPPVSGQYGATAQKTA
jgi:K+-sensing histidine kinase KdpD